MKPALVYPVAQSVRAFCHDILAQAQVCDELLELAILVLEQLDPPQLADAQLAIFFQR